MDISQYLNGAGEQAEPTKLTKGEVYKMAEGWGYLNYPIEYAAARLGVSVKKVQAMLDDPQSKFAQAWKRGDAKAVEHILRRQFQAALDGNTAMLAHMGELRLGQKSLILKQQNESIKKVEEYDEDMYKKLSKKAKRLLMQEAYGIQPLPTIDDGTSNDTFGGDRPTTEAESAEVIPPVDS